MTKEMEKAFKKIRETIGDAEEVKMQQFIYLAMSGQPCDVTTHSGARYLEVKIDNLIFSKIISGIGNEKLAKELENIKLKKGNRKVVGTVSFNDIWLLVPMPANGFSEEELKNVDITKGEEKIMPGQDVTLRESIRKGYHCKNEKEVEKFLKRFLAS